jgi:hypothetical protein
MAISDRPLTSLQSVILITGPFVFLWSYLRQYVTRNGPLRIAKPLKTINSTLLAIFHAALGYFVLNDIFHFHDQPAIPSNTSNGIIAPLLQTLGLNSKQRISSDDLGYLFHLSQIYVYASLLLLVALGHPIPSSTAFQYLTSPFLTYFRVLNGTAWHWFVFLSCVHNTAMYWCSSFEGMEVRLGWLRPLVMVTEWLQLVVATGVDAWYVVGEGRDGEEVNERGIAILLWLRYGMLLWKETEEERKKIGKVGEDVKENVQLMKEEKIVGSGKGRQKTRKS